MTYKGELIGQQAKVRDIHTRQEWLGEIVNETKQTLQIRSANRTSNNNGTVKDNVKVFKKNIEVVLVAKNITLSGVDLLKRPEERMKE